MWRIASAVPLGQPRHLRMATYNLSWPAPGTDQDQVKDLVVTSFGPTMTSSHGNIWLVLARPRNWSRSSEGPCHLFLRANHHVFAWQRVNSHGQPKESTEATSKIYFSVASWRPVTFTYFQHYSDYLFMTETTCKFTEQASLPYFQ
jgi:hypothetical protein